MPDSTPLHVIVLAAGHGTRMKTSHPKLLHAACGRTLVDWTCDAVLSLAPTQFVAVCPDADGAVAQAFAARGATIAVQAEPRGTGDAVARGLALLDDSAGAILVTNGDLPCLRGETLAELLAAHQSAGNQATMLSGYAPEPTGWGRIVRGDDGAFTTVVEEADADDLERTIAEVNVGPVVCDGARLRPALAAVTPQGPRNELYFPIALANIRAAGGTIDAVPLADPDEVAQVNTQAELAAATDELRFRVVAGHLAAGVTVVDPSTTYIEPGVTIGAGTVIHPFCVLRSGVTVGAGCEVGPFAHLRAGADLRDGAAIGNYVEVKQSVIHERAKAKHLAYLGNAEVGPGANVGAGTITANYDGTRKHPTRIGAGTRVGSNTVLVAPVTLGARVVTGAGSVVLQDVPDDTTVVGVPARPLRRNAATGEGATP